MNAIDTLKELLKHAEAERDIARQEDDYYRNAHCAASNRFGAAVDTVRQLKQVIEYMEAQNG